MPPIGICAIATRKAASEADRPHRERPLTHREPTHVARVRTIPTSATMRFPNSTKA